MRPYAALKMGILLSAIVAGVPMAQAVAVSGGNYSTNYILNGTNFTAVVFTNSGTLTVAIGGNVDVLVVAGGGGGGVQIAGGGGAGGLVYSNSYPVAAGSKSVVVGAGGAGGTSGAGVTGNNSSFGSLTANGGGGGGGNGLPGGSGGGGGNGANGGASNASGQGNAGAGGGYSIGGGGGGAGSAGASGSSSTGAGGTGAVYDISGVLTYYAGGGGGGSRGTGAAGGPGGGGMGGGNTANTDKGTNGVAGTGGGGGGGGNATGGTHNGGAGGSGIVIVRYLTVLTPSVINLAPTNVSTGAAFLNGQIASTGIAPVTAVSVYWGTTDGGTNTTLWANTNVFSGGPWNMGDVLTANLAPLSPATDYYYTYSSSNAYGAALAPSSQYFITGELTAQATDPYCGSNLLDTATVVVSRPATCTNGPVMVYYTLGGSATNGVDYSASPASGSLIIPAGQTSATVTCTPIMPPWNTGTARNFALTLLSGAYAIGAANSATCTLVSLQAANYTWDGASADWTNAVHWTGGVGGTPRNGSTGIVASGQAKVTTTNSDLYNPALGSTAPAAILIQANGTLNYASGYYLSRDHNLVLDGGTWGMNLGNYTPAESYTHTVRVRHNSTLNVTLQGNTSFTIGNLADYDAASTGMVTVPGACGGNTYLGLASSSPNFSGGWTVQGGALLVGLAPNALGTGSVIVTNGSVYAYACDSNLPSITVWNGGTFAMMTNHYNVAPGQAITVNDGGSIGGGGGFLAPYHPTSYLDAPVHVSGNVTTLSGYQISFMNDFFNSGTATLTVSGFITHFGKPNNAYTGNWIMNGGNTVDTSVDGGLGTGAVDVRSALSITKSLTLHNMISGNGSVGSSSYTLTLQPWYANALLSSAGVAPGTNFGSAIGTLAVPGNLNFTNLPNYDDFGNSAYCTLAIKFGGTKANPTNDLVTATGTILGIGNVDLTVTAAGAVAVGTYPIFVATNNFSGQSFHSTAFNVNGVTGHLLYNNGNVQVQFMAAGTTLIVQ